ncbi:Syntaxin 6, N-terminal [Musa troglodytarum]|nr:Syntaxin 6, N-terminal [Musa troglodytarum]URD73081.1 Syntaxin 6, N-terminal [Musa troglodytarum]
MESVFRILLHEQKSVQGDSLDAKLLSSIEYHKRDLVTCLETARWQLEDFERAVTLAALSDTSNSRENAISKFRQFIRAIREQISQVEKTVKDSAMEDFNRTSPSMNLNEHDRDGLALFLSGGDHRDNQLDYDSSGSIMKRFLNSTTDGDEIVELKTEEVLPTNGLKYLDHGYEKARPHHSRRVTEAPAILEDSFGDKGCQEACTAFGSFNIKFGDFAANSYGINRTRGSFWMLLRNFWPPNKNRVSLTKRRKDGEDPDDLIVDTERNIPHSVIDVPPSGQVQKHEGMIRALHLHGLIGSTWRRLQRSLYFIVYHRRPVQVASAVLIALAILAFLSFCII